jgi:hypothetical protein
MEKLSDGPRMTYRMRLITPDSEEAKCEIVLTRSLSKLRPALASAFHACLGVCVLAVYLASSWLARTN